MWEPVWHYYTVKISTGKRSFEREIQATDDDDAYSRAFLKVLKIEEEWAEVVAWSVINNETGEITHSRVYMSALDYI